MNKKRTLIVIASFLMCSAFASLAIFLPNESLGKTKANAPYNCELPSEYHEIEDVITDAINNGEKAEDPGEYIYLTKPFRGTVTYLDGDNAYVQRRNQTNELLDGIKIKGLTSYGSSIHLGNVVDFNDGLLYLDNGTPTLELDALSQYEVAYTENPYGFTPDVYDSPTIYANNGFRENDYHQYDYSKLITIRYAHISGYNPTTIDVALFGGEETIFFEFDDLANPYAYFDAYVDTGSDLEDEQVIAKLDEAFKNNDYIDVTGYMTCHGYYYPNIFHIKDVDDVVIGSQIVETHFDSTLFTSKRSFRTYFDSEQYMWSDLYMMPDSDIPYVRFEDFYNDNFCWSLGIDDETHLIKKVSSLSGVTTYSNLNEDASVVIRDHTTLENQNTITFTGNQFISLDWLGKTSVGSYLITGLETDYCHFNDALSIQHSPSISSKTFDLDSYNIDIYTDAYGDVYLPLQTANDLCLSTNRFTFSYNGQDCYYSDAIDSDNDPFMVTRYYYSTPTHDNPAMGSEEYCEFAYNEMCFAIDNSYGLLEHRGETSADSLFTSMGLKTSLSSSNRDDYETAICEFAGKWLYEGHAGYSWRSPVTDYLDKGYQNYLDVHNARYHQLNDNYAIFAAARNAAGYDVGLRIYEDVAIITFDSFVKYCDGDSKEIDVFDYSWEELHNMGTDLLFKRAFGEIDPDTIKYVVFDTTMNGGGMVDAMPFLEAYMTSDPSLTFRNRLTNEVSEIHYQVDLNQNGFFGEPEDTYEGQFEFYLLTSTYSFSCGNYFPTVIKEKGMATIFGHRSGGGSCVVGAISNAHGSIFRSSSNFQMGYMDSDVFHNNEDGIDVDGSFAVEDYYKDEEIRKFILGIY